jgi:hypothetical protein
MLPSAVVDASILVRAFLFPGSVPGHVLKWASEARFQMHLSPIDLLTLGLFQGVRIITACAFLAET